jgi:hypothetical protein
LPSWKVSSFRHLRQIASTSWARVTSSGVQQRKKERSPFYRCQRATRTLVPFSSCWSGVSSAWTSGQAQSYSRVPFVPCPVCMRTHWCGSTLLITWWAFHLRPAPSVTTYVCDTPPA